MGGWVKGTWDLTRDPLTRTEGVRAEPGLCLGPAGQDAFPFVQINKACPGPAPNPTGPNEELH